MCVGELPPPQHVYKTHLITVDQGLCRESFKRNVLWEKVHMDVKDFIALKYTYFDTFFFHESFEDCFPKWEAVFLFLSDHLF